MVNSVPFSILFFSAPGSTILQYIHKQETQINLANLYRKLILALQEFSTTSLSSGMYNIVGRMEIILGSFKRNNRV